MTVKQELVAIQMILFDQQHWSDGKNTAIDCYQMCYSNIENIIYS